MLSQNAQRTSWFDAVDMWADDNNDDASRSQPLSPPTDVKREASATGCWPGRLGLLSRLSVFCLKEHLVHSSTQQSPPVHPLLPIRLNSYCLYASNYAFRVNSLTALQNCLLLDRTSGENPADALMHHTVLTIGDTTFNDKNADPTSGVRPVVVVRGVGRTRSLARQQASLSAFKQLAQLQPNINP
ncbi:hypothetical protein AHF37_04800 [Paragonimus kellicotti]|nr:hypothetical protein AHF37_04800 [Paragonimus kellicotti]